MRLASLQSAAGPEPADAALAYAGAVLLLSAACSVPLVTACVRRLVPGRGAFFARWGFTHVLLALLVFVAASALVARLAGGGGAPDLLAGLAASALLLGIACLVPLAYARRLDPEGVRALGLRAAGSGRAALAGLCAYLPLLPGLLGVGLLWPWVLERLGAEWTAQPHLVAFLDLSGARLAAAVVLAVGVIPFWEELLFRGFVQPLFVQNFRDGGGVAATSLLFAALHGRDAFLPVFFLSLLLGGIMLRTQRLAAAWAVHATHNGLVIAALFLPGGLRDLLE